LSGLGGKRGAGDQGGEGDFGQCFHVRVFQFCDRPSVAAAFAAVLVVDPRERSSTGASPTAAGFLQLSAVGLEPLISRMGADALEQRRRSPSAAGTPRPVAALPADGKTVG
jgi:hypothetical protein